MQFLKSFRQYGFLALGAFCVTASYSQSIQMSSESFQDRPLLPFASPSGVGSSLPSGKQTQLLDRPPSSSDASSSLRTWRVQSEDVRLSTTLERWSKDAGYNLIWDAQKQVLLSAKDSFNGTFEEALSRVLSSPAIRKSDYPLEACFYPNQPPVIRVTRLGEQTEECPL